MTRKPSRTSLLCPNCRRLISNDEPLCPYCGIRKPGSGLKNNAMVRGMSDPDLIFKVIIGVNVVMYIVSLAVSMVRGEGIGITGNPLSLFSPSNEAMLFLGASGVYPIKVAGHWWSLVAANWLHGSVLHIVFNMLAFRNLAPFVMREFGTYRLVIIFILGGVASYLVSFLAGVTFTIGASGAVCALVGAALYFGKSRGGAYGNAVYRQVSGWVVSIALFGFVVPGINNWAHGGGIIAGAGLAWALGYLERKRESQRDKFLALLCGVVTAASLLLAVFTAATTIHIR
ncbi:rhomboid family intramembrane serine protease [Desulfoluna spongiiphila]|uniref:Rhomboid protease GluP n=1 Tax=Desulfoluna spongiiphila TaxID=419481 RepID=A0A1G5HT14_9BACT|nr:rhomboid family intramembrane serine protease [Desulfoluna spongiiphila]SCY66831.1 rhomboid protease GluP [Desulfoluna spongiiphila]VVS91848.1 peptidase s54 rhomboid domain [Desulfoluna spongiiphila]